MPDTTSLTAKVAPRWVSRNSCRRPLAAAPLPTAPSQAKKSLGLPVLGSAASRDASSLRRMSPPPMSARDHNVGMHTCSLSHCT